MSTQSAAAVASVTFDLDTELAALGIPPEVIAIIKPWIAQYFTKKIDAVAWQLYTKEQGLMLLSIHEKLLKLIPVSVSFPLSKLDGIIEPEMERLFGPPPAGTPGVPAK